MHTNFEKSNEMGFEERTTKKVSGQSRSPVNKGIWVYARFEMALKETSRIAKNNFDKNIRILLYKSAEYCQYNKQKCTLKFFPPQSQKLKTIKKQPCNVFICNGSKECKMRMKECLYEQEKLILLPKSNSCHAKNCKYNTKNNELFQIPYSPPSSSEGPKKKKRKEKRKRQKEIELSDLKGCRILFNENNINPNSGRPDYPNYCELELTVNGCNNLSLCFIPFKEEFSVKFGDSKAVIIKNGKITKLISSNTIQVGTLTPIYTFFNHNRNEETVDVSVTCTPITGYKVFNGYTYCKDSKNDEDMDSTIERKVGDEVNSMFDISDHGYDSFENEISENSIGRDDENMYIYSDMFLKICKKYLNRNKYVDMWQNDLTFWVVRAGNVGVLRFLVKMNLIDYERVDVFGNCLLHYAYFEGNKEIIHELCREERKVNKWILNRFKMVPVEFTKENVRRVMYENEFKRPWINFGTIIDVINGNGVLTGRAVDHSKHKYEVCYERLINLCVRPNKNFKIHEKNERNENYLKMFKEIENEKIKLKIFIIEPNSKDIPANLQLRFERDRLIHVDVVGNSAVFGSIPLKTLGNMKNNVKFEIVEKKMDGLDVKSVRFLMIPPTNKLENDCYCPFDLEIVISEKGYFLFKEVMNKYMKVEECGKKLKNIFMN